MKIEFEIIQLLENLREKFARRRHLTLMKCILTLGILTLGLPIASARTLQSPRNVEISGDVPMAKVVLPATKKIRLGWDYPAISETADLIFKLYHYTNLAMPLSRWDVLTNIPGNLRVVEIVINKPQDFFALTASNYLGESNFAR